MDDKVYVNINNEQDLITLLGSPIIPEFSGLGMRIEGLLLSSQDDPGLRALLERQGIGLRHMPYSRSPRCAALDRLIARVRNLRYYGRSPKTSTLYVKSVIGYRNGEFNLKRFRFLNLLGRVADSLRILDPILIRLYARSIRGLGALDGPVLCLDYIHNGYQIELSVLNRGAGKPYIAYVANLDQVTNYPPHLDIPDVIFTWGAFHRKILAERYRIPAAKIRSAGFCRSDNLVGHADGNPDSACVVYFCASNLSNDPDFGRNLGFLMETLEEKAAPYVLMLKKHPGSESDLWDRHLEIVRGADLKHGRIELVGNTWDKYSKLGKQDLTDKDFSYRDLKQLLAACTHAFSSTSTTTLEAALAGARSYFINIDGAVDGCFRFEHLRILSESGLIPMVRSREDLRRIFRDTSAAALKPNTVVDNIGSGSRTLALECRALLYPGLAGSDPLPKARSTAGLP